MSYVENVNIFKKNFKNNVKPVIGTFIKSESVSTVEILSNAGLDFLVIDAEHAPFTRREIDLFQLAARASSIPILVRIPEVSVTHILNALDSGACGVIAPHIDTKEKAQKLVEYCLYKYSRGFSNSPRAGNYGNKSAWEHVENSDNNILIIAMIEDKNALINLDEILSVDGLNGIFIGRGDLAISLNDRSSDYSETNNHVGEIIKKANNLKKSIMIVPNSNDEIYKFFSAGVAGFICSSDQGFLKNGAINLLKNLKFKSEKE